MRWTMILACLVLAGCVSVADYQPAVTDITDQAVLTRDEAVCRSVALGYEPGLDIGNITSQAVQGGASNLAGAAVNAWVPVLGAAGGASSAALNGFGVLKTDQRKVFLKCLDHRGVKSGAYSVIDPNE